MGSTIKVIFQEDDLSDPDHRDMYIEVDDLIRLHYRDLQLDFGRKEFESFVRNLKQQADSLMKVIDQTDCGEAPDENFDGEEFKIWSLSQLPAKVSAYPSRVSLEESSDGYHLNYRNYNLLLDEKGYQSLKNAFAADPEAVPYAEGLEGLKELFRLNRIVFKVLNEDAPTGGKSVYKVEVPERHVGKARAVMAGIGMEGRLKVNGVMYAKPGLSIDLIEIEDDNEAETETEVQASAATAS